MKKVWLLFLVACGSPTAGPDAAVPDAAPAAPRPMITATVGSTRFVTREHMLAAGEMQISGEPLAEAMSRDLTSYSRFHVPQDLYFDRSQWAAGPWIDLAGFSTGVESYEYSKQPMNNLAFESGAGTSLAYAPLVTDLAALVQHYGIGSNANGRFVFPPGTDPVDPASAPNNLLGWPGLWPTNHVFASFDPAIAPSGSVDLRCSISSDDDPGAGGTLKCADYECDATTLHLANRATQIDPTITPGSDGFSGWKYGLWVMNYLQIMHDAAEAAVATVPMDELAKVGIENNQVVGADDSGAPTIAGTFLGSSAIEGFQAQLFIAMADNRAEDWLRSLTTTDGSSLSGFASIDAASRYGYGDPLRWFPSRVGVTETSGAPFPQPAYALASPDSELMDLVGMTMGYAEIFALTDARNPNVGGSQPALAFFDGDPFAPDDALADGEPSLHDRSLAMMRVALVDLDRLHTDPTSGLLVDHVAMNGATPSRGTTISTTSVAYTVIGLRTALRSLSGQLELYSNNTPDSAIGSTPLDPLPIAYPQQPSLVFSARVRQILVAHATLLLDHLTDATGRAYSGWDVIANAPIDQSDTLDAHAAAIRGLFAAYFATGDVRYHDRALAVWDRMQRVFYDADARIWTVAPAPQDEVTYTPLRFALVQSALRDMYELVAARPGGEAQVADLEAKLARLDKLVLNGWDDRNQNRLVDYPAECVNVVDALPRGGLQMAERTLTGEIGIYEEAVKPGKSGTPTDDREQDCVPEIDDAKLPAGLADSITFHITRTP
ncbi:MAG TPA: hypothetical protein VL463_15135 [Kofleriaceae bacterium]|nr:hypothetical protein [Kofleriaceae bacterium]